MTTFPTQSPNPRIGGPFDQEDSLPFLLGHADVASTQAYSHSLDAPQAATLPPEASQLTPRLVTRLLGYNRYDIAKNFGVTSRQQIHNILTGRSNHPKLLCALHAETMRLLKIKLDMGIKI